MSKATKNALKSAGRQTVAQAKNVLRMKGITGSKLEESVSYKVVQKGGKWILEFYMNDYGRFLNEGVSGNKKTQYYVDETGRKKKSPNSYKNSPPPSDVFEKFIKRKGIKGRSKKTGRFITRKSLAFIMARYRMINGYAGLSFFTKPLNSILTKFPKNLLDSIEKEYITTLEPK